MIKVSRIYITNRIVQSYICFFLSTYTFYWLQQVLYIVPVVGLNVSGDVPLEMTIGSVHCQ